MDNYTQGKWEFSVPHIVAYGETGGVVCAIGEPKTKSNRVEYERLEINSPNWSEAMGNAELIVSAVNACIEINPDNPKAVAESIKAMYEALKEVRMCLRLPFMKPYKDEPWAERVLHALNLAEGRE